MSFNFPPDRALQDKAKAKMRKILLERSFMERWEPVANEMRWVIAGRPNEPEHKKILPAYCYEIFDLYQRTIFKGFTPISEVITISDKERAATCKSIEEAKQCIKIDWAKLGSVFSIGERVAMHYENEAEAELQRAGLHDLTPEKDKDLYKLLVGDRWMKKKLAEIQAREPEKPVEEIIDGKFNALVETTKKAVPEWHQKARDWEPEAVTKFHAGVSTGSTGFMDKNGELTGESKMKLKKTYEFLLIVWPEIEEMLKAEPPKTRNHLWDWLRPFSYALWIEIQDLEQLNRMCTVIKLKLKKPGAPAKSK